MKTRPNALDNAENESGSAKHENGIRRPRYRRKRVRARKTWKRTRRPGNRRKRVRERKTWKRGPTPSEPPKTSPGAQNMKTGPDDLGIAENEYGCAKYENESRRPRNRQKRVRERKTWKRVTRPSVPSKTSPGAQNMKTGPDAIGIAENEFGSAKHENGIRRTRYRRKWVRARKIWKRDPTPSIPPKTCSEAQNMKTGPDSLGTAENVSGNAFKLICFCFLNCIGIISESLTFYFAGPFSESLSCYRIFAGCWST
jgi:hypothetical protein